ncbi:hypothetical protein [Yersinia enterocolitica]|uniref:hypothetical protein n=1 Tax=Yersinia enterocolitica TaxID=630 RepID=UPI0015F1735F|nr:hypothetical protein [Yersinia enterocolitica]
MAAIPERYFQEKTLGLLGASIYEPPGHLARKDDRNSLGGFHHGSGAIAPIKKPDIWLQYLSAIFKKKHLVYWERPYMARL